MTNGKGGRSKNPYPSRTGAGINRKKFVKNTSSTSSKIKGKYFLDEIDGITYSTDSYEIYNLYNNLFYKKKETEYIPVKKSHTPSFAANNETWKEGLQEEQERYDNGYVYRSEWVTLFGKEWKKGRWVKKEID